MPCARCGAHPSSPRGHPDPRRRDERGGQHVRDRQRVHVPAAAGRPPRGADVDQHPRPGSPRCRTDCRFAICRTTVRRARCFTDSLATHRGLALDAGDGAERVTLEMVTDNYFSLLGVRPAARTSDSTERRPRARRRAGAGPGARVLAVALRGRSVGRRPRVRLNGRRSPSSASTPPTFDGTDALVRVAAYAPPGCSTCDEHAGHVDPRAAPRVSSPCSGG